ncbi:MAG: hypothetical protein ACP5HU_08785 [Phycisphaerae bacterium]
MSRKSLLQLLCCVLIAAFSLGQVQVVTLKNGSAVRGVVTRTDGQYEVRLSSGIVVVFPVAEVESISDVVSVESSFQQRKSETDLEDPDERYKLAEWAYEREMYAEARQELEAVLELDADHERSQLLLRQVQARLEATTQPVEEAPSGDPRESGTVRVRSDWLVDQEDIYRIRRAELREDDRVVIKYRNDVIERFIERMEGVAEFRQEQFSDTFRGWDAPRQTRYMLDELDDPQNALAQDILIESDPQFMVEFRSRIWPAIARQCASASCHGGDRVVGNLKLFNVVGHNERVLYTNFALLDGYVKDGARMIDRDRPEESLLLQYMLPRDQAERKHPEQLTPVFPSRQSAAYRRVEQWIDSLQGPPHPRYELQYDPPFGMTLHFRTLPAFLREMEEEAEEEQQD